MLAHLIGTGGGEVEQVRTTSADGKPSHSWRSSGVGSIALLKKGLKLLYSSWQFLQGMEELAVLPC